MIKKIVYLVVVICLVFSIPSNASSIEMLDGETKNVSVDYYSDSEINEINNLSTTESNNAKINPAIMSSTTYVEYPVSYNPSTTKIKYEGFEIGTISFDTRDEDYPTTLSLTYQESQTVSWSISGTVSATAEFNVIATKVEATVSATVATSSSTGTAIGASITKTINPDKYGYIKVYAHGVNTSGAVKYRWYDRLGNSGYINKQISAKLPLDYYNQFSVHFGNLVYQ